MNYSKEAKKVANKDIRKYLREQGKVYINCSLRVLKELQIIKLERNGKTDW